MSQNIMCREKNQSRHTPAAITLVGSDESFVILSSFFFFVSSFNFIFIAPILLSLFRLSNHHERRIFFFFTLTILCNDERMSNIIRKAHAIQNFRNKLFWFNIHIYIFFCLVLWMESFAYAVIACISISFGWSAATHLCFWLHIVCGGEQERNISMYCRFTVPLVLFHVLVAAAAAMFFFFHPDYFTSLSLK